MNSAAQGEAPGEAVVADYLANRLSEAEAQAFEEYCLQHPAFAREVERELELKTGLRHAHQSAAPVSSPAPPHRYGRWPLALAASVAVIFGAVLVFHYLIEKRSPLVAYDSKLDLPIQLQGSSASRVTLIRMRGKDAAAQIPVTANGVIEIRLLPDSDSKSGSYSVRIVSESPLPVKPLTVRHLRAADDGYLQLYVPASQMIGRTWLISLADGEDFGESQHTKIYQVQFVAAPGPAG